MSGNTFGKLFSVTTFGESHGTALGCIIDGCPPGLELSSSDLQHDLNRRKPGQSRYTTQRKEDDEVEILSGVFEGVTTGTPIGLMVRNQDQKSKDYSKIRDLYRPAHADYAYDRKYGIRDYRGGGRSSARETTMGSPRVRWPRNGWPSAMACRLEATSVSWGRFLRAPMIGTWWSRTPSFVATRR